MSSDNRLAEKIGIKRQTIHQWRQGTAPIADERIAQLCAIGKLDAPRWIAKIHAERAESPTERAAWKSMLERLTATAATLLVGASITCPTPSQAQSISKNFNSEIHIMPIMSTWRRWVRELASSLEKRLKNRLLVHA
ncbi:hypothetical protein XFHB_13645 [Xylella fastidiosa]|uniref:Uncharacterized protein n=1 Tax=Xylella fastidiosa TaxID=2371 RepID=A0ABD7BYI2_XYLFS|nr:hypothetical protein XFHB_13645 [Xylella fastidiosa]